MSQNTVGTLYERPWGTYKTTDMHEGFQVKTITVNPGGRLSLQSHAHRSEHWVVVAGTATITIDDDVADYAVGAHVFIPIQAKHRLENLTEQPVVIVEVQVGDYLGEDDIVRYDDVYGRG